MSPLVKRILLTIAALAIWTTLLMVSLWGVRNSGASSDTQLLADCFYGVLVGVPMGAGITAIWLFVR